MLKNIVKLEVQIGEKLYHLFCDTDSPIAHVKEAIFQLTKIVADIEENILSAQKKEPESQQPEVNTEEVK